MVVIENSDNLCAVRAISVGLCRLTLTTEEEFLNATRDVPGDNIDKVLNSNRCSPSIYRQVRKSDSIRKTQFKMAERIMHIAGLPLLSRALIIDDLGVIEEVLNINVAVISADTGNKFVRKPNQRSRKTIYLYLHDNHLDVISSITGFCSSSYFCQRCTQPYSSASRRSYVSCCTSCGSNDCQEETQIEFPNCHLLCRSADRMVRRRTCWYGPSYCETYYRCTTFNKVMKEDKKEEHACGEYKCKFCKDYVMPGHLCYQRALPDEKTEPQYIFFEFETTQNTICECDAGYHPEPRNKCKRFQPGMPCSGCQLCQHCLMPTCGKQEHVPNLLVAYTVCPFCHDTDSLTCDVCGLRCPSCTQKPCPRCPLSKELAFTESYHFFRWLFSPQYKVFV